jgi:murein DD-endopeptidase MepM/ murein hydrolase activator NlpD
MIIAFIQRLLKFRKNLVTIFVMDESHPDQNYVFKLIPQQLFVMTTALFLGFLTVVIAILFLTPLGAVIVGKEDEALHDKAYELSIKLNAMRDSLENRDRQLYNIKAVLIGEQDTSFVLNEELLTNSDGMDAAEIYLGEMMPEKVQENKEPPVSEVLFFPIEAPARGQYSREFNAETGHFGLDIAAKEGSSVWAIADGVVIQAEWTMNYGNVIYIQHQSGYISVFKHCSTLFKKVGDVVAKNDIVGTVGDGGVISSGPHLHFELWRDGVPLDPKKYLVD